MNSARLANLRMLQFIAFKLGDTCNELVFLGGSTTGLFITDLAAPDVRATFDVDCIVDVVSIAQYYKLEQKLLERGFKKDLNDEVVCRWHYDDMILDVMPTDEKILGFGNRWYKAVIKNAIDYILPENVKIKTVTAPYLIATKLEAFRNRGMMDYMASHDFEDIIAVLDGRSEIVEEVHQSDPEVKKYLIEAFNHIIMDKKFHTALPGHLNQYASLSKVREAQVLDRINRIAIAI